jgi:hypothetical protein
MDKTTVRVHIFQHIAASSQLFLRLRLPQVLVRMVQRNISHFLFRGSLEIDIYNSIERPLRVVSGHLHIP